MSVTVRARRLHLNQLHDSGISLEFQAAVRLGDGVVDTEAEINAQTARDQNNSFAALFSRLLRGPKK